MEQARRRDRRYTLKPGDSKWAVIDLIVVFIVIPSRAVFERLEGRGDSHRQQLGENNPSQQRRRCEGIHSHS